MPPRFLVALHAAGLLGAASPLEDSVAMVQTRSVSVAEQEPAGSTCTFDGCGPPWEEQVVTVFSKATSTTSPCYDCAETGFMFYMRNNVPAFLFQPWRRTVTIATNSGRNQQVYPLPWSPTADAWHNQTVVCRNNGVHTYIFTDGGDPNYVFRVDFFHKELFARNDREYGMFNIYTPVQPRPSGASERTRGEILNGQSVCYSTTATEDHCLKVPAGSQRYEKHPLTGPYIQDTSNTPKICRAWGDPHYTTFDGVKYNFMGTGTFTVSKVDTGSNEHTLQVFNCPVKSGSTWNRRITQGIALALRIAGRTLTLYKSVVKVDGKAMSKRLHYFEGLILDVQTDTIHHLGWRSSFSTAGEGTTACCPVVYTHRHDLNIVVYHGRHFSLNTRSLQAMKLARDPL